jgi:hypothetical protein
MAQAYSGSSTVIIFVPAGFSPQTSTIIKILL